jgi:quinol monooxygenase YgiN
MTVVIVADVQCTPGRRGEFVRAVAGMVRDTREQPGFEGIDVTRADGQDDLVVMVERWESVESYQRYLAWRAERGDRAQLYSLMAHPPVFRYLQVEPIGEPVTKG